MQIVERVQYETAKDYVLRLLKTNIKTLELAPGSQISENELSAVLGISRTPIREALAELSKVRLVEVIPQKKTTVTLIDYRLVEEAWYMRYTLETALMDPVCLKRTEKDLAALEENIVLQELYLENGSKEKLMEKDDAFHRCFFEITGKMEIYQLMQNLMIHFDRVRNMSIGTVRDLKIVKDHRAILDAIRDSDAAAAKRLLAAHLTRYRVDASAIQAKYPDYFPH